MGIKKLFSLFFPYFRFKISRHLKFKYELAFVAIAKNEGRYFKEWIDFHRLVGVEKFYIYDNESTDNTRAVLQPFIDSGLVEYNFFPGIGRQMQVYMDAAARHKNECKWMGFIDLDEFVVPIANKTIPEFLKNFNAYAAVGINWVVYGSGHDDKESVRGDGLVMERFKDHADQNFEYATCIKTIANPRLISNMLNPHTIIPLCGKLVDSEKNQYKDNDWLNNPLPPQISKIRINHYAVKSYQEFLEKSSRGYCDVEVDLKANKYFEINNRNEVKNDTIMDRFIKLMK